MDTYFTKKTSKLKAVNWSASLNLFAPINNLFVFPDTENCNVCVIYYVLHEIKAEPSQIL